jgi:hypothetical protein
MIIPEGVRKRLISKAFRFWGPSQSLFSCIQSFTLSAIELKVTHQSWRDSQLLLLGTPLLSGAPIMARAIVHVLSTVPLR